MVASFTAAVGDITKFEFGSQIFRKSGLDSIVASNQENMKLRGYPSGGWEVNCYAVFSGRWLIL
jgi:hypothetical protein